MKSTASEVWSNCLTYIKDNINNESFKTWFTPIKAIKLKEKTLTIEVPSKFFYEWIEENYIDLLTSAIKKQLGEESKLVYSIMMENIYGNLINEDSFAFAFERWLKSIYENGIEQTIQVYLGE